MPYTSALKVASDFTSKMMSSFCNALGSCCLWPDVFAKVKIINEFRQNQLTSHTGRKYISQM